MSATLNIVSKYDGRGVRRAKTDLKGIGKVAIGTKAGVLAALWAVERLAKSSAEAFIADEKAMARLDNLMRNFGMGNAVSQNEAFIASMQKSSGILDDELRPAMEKFILATKNVAVAQDLMQTAVDISAGTGKDLETVAIALSRALTGNRRGLLSLNTGIDASILKTGSLSQVFAELTKRFNGANFAQIGTRARQIADAEVIIADAQEAIGKRVTDIVATQIRGFQTMWDWAVKFKEWFTAEDAKTPLGGTMFMGKRIGWTAKRPDGPAKKEISTTQQWIKAQDRKTTTIKKQNAAKSKSLQLTRLQAKYDLELIGLAAAKKRTSDKGTLGRLNDLTTIAQANAGLPVSASALAGAKNTQVPNITINAGSVIHERELVDMISRAVMQNPTFGFGYGKWGGGL